MTSSIMLKSLTLLTFIIVCFQTLPKGYETTNQNRLYKRKAISFLSMEDTLSGYINVPKVQDRKKDILLIFVHGDGKLSNNAFGYYKPIWKTLAKEGIHTMSWDKKGIGLSTGNWLSQSMSDRATEVIDAINYIESDSNYQFSTIGLIGFSQAGWVLPKVAVQSPNVDFIISCSGAINWKKQSNYLTTKRLEGEKRSPEYIKAAIERNQIEFGLFEQDKTYQDYLKYVNDKNKSNRKSELLTRDRYYFIQKNINADATKELKKVQCPVMAIFGDKDLNVDYLESYQTYRRIFTDTLSMTKIYPDATHGLLRYQFFDTSDPGTGFFIKLKLFGQKAFAKNVLEDICNFAIKNHLK